MTIRNDYHIKARRIIEKQRLCAFLICLMTYLQLTFVFLQVTLNYVAK